MIMLNGKCEKRPEACAEIYAPVCGCDGKTYGNSCDAYMAGVSIAWKGECKTAGKTCYNDQKCGANSFCNFADGACKSLTTTLLQGKCVEKPEACAEIYAPVCGCDGKTYGNRCDALGAGVSIDHEGECQKDKCWGAWLDENGRCRTPADGVYPDECCWDQKQERC